MAEQLWAPWRLKYIESANDGSACIFCEFFAAPPEDDARNLLLFRGEHALIMLNAFPYANGHLMVAPYRHTSSLEDYSDPELLEVMRLKRVAARLLGAEVRPDGFNMGLNMGRVAGAGIADHLHWHVVPRWNGDTNFMPVLADVRVIPESLEVMYSRLHAALHRLLASEGAARRD